MIEKLVDQCIDKVVDFCSLPENRCRIEEKIVRPLGEYSFRQFSWIARMFQVLASLVVFQTILLVWLAFIAIRERPAAAAAATAAAAAATAVV